MTQHPIAPCTGIQNDAWFRIRRAGFRILKGLIPDSGQHQSFRGFGIPDSFTRRESQNLVMRSDYFGWGTPIRSTNVLFKRWCRTKNTASVINVGIICVCRYLRQKRDYDPDFQSFVNLQRGARNQHMEVLLLRPVSESPPSPPLAFPFSPHYELFYSPFLLSLPPLPYLLSSLYLPALPFLSCCPWHSLLPLLSFYPLLSFPSPSLLFSLIPSFLSFCPSPPLPSSSSHSRFASPFYPLSTPSISAHVFLA